MSRDALLGERRHETCRFGTLTPAIRISAATGGETPTVIPLCNWQPTAAPPAIRRAWGGDIEFDRDCAVCPVYATVAPREDGQG